MGALQHKVEGRLVCLPECRNKRGACRCYYFTSFLFDYQKLQHQYQLLKRQEVKYDLVFISNLKIISYLDNGSKYR